MTEATRRFRIDCAEALTRECLLAEAFEAGAAGVEEIEGEGRFRADIYVVAERVERVRAALESFGADDAWIGPSEGVPEVDWSEAWREGLDAIEISPRLLVLSSIAQGGAKPGQRQILIEPGQAFGTGGHASTRLCLEWIDALLAEGEGMLDIDRVLDVGTGSGVLALAAVALGAKRALGFDLDPVATRAAESAARQNGLTDRVDFFTGPIEAVTRDEPPFPLVVANLLKSEVLPIATEIADRVAVDGRLVLAGLLEEDLAEVLDRFAGHGLEEIGRRQEADGIGLWVGPCLTRR